MKKNIYLTFTLVLVFLVFLYHKNVTSNIIIAINLFKNNVFPSLFPLMVISPFLIEYGFLDMMKKVVGPLMPRLFNISENTAYILIMSLLSGFPGSAIYVKDLVDKNIISSEEAEQIILFSHFSNPIFIFSMIKNNPFLVLTIHYLVNIIIGILFKLPRKKESKSFPTSKDSSNFFKIFKQSINNSIENTLFVFGIITFFYMITAIIDTPITNALLELSQGLSYINSLNLSYKLQDALSGMLLSFGCFSVHLQTYGILSNMNIKYNRYIKARLIHALLTFILIMILA